MNAIFNRYDYHHVYDFIANNKKKSNEKKVSRARSGLLYYVKATSMCSRSAWIERIHIFFFNDKVGGARWTLFTRRRGREALFTGEIAAGFDINSDESESEENSDEDDLDYHSVVTFY